MKNIFRVLHRYYNFVGVYDGGGTPYVFITQFNAAGFPFISSKCIFDYQ